MLLSRRFAWMLHLSSAVGISACAFIGITVLTPVLHGVDRATFSVLGLLFLGGLGLRH